MTALTTIIYGLNAAISWLVQYAIVDFLYLLFWLHIVLVTYCFVLLIIFFYLLFSSTYCFPLFFYYTLLTVLFYSLFNSLLR